MLNKHKPLIIMKLTYFESDDRIIVLYHALIFKNLFHEDKILSRESYKNNDKIFVDNISNPRFATNGTDKYYTINNGVIKSYKYYGLGKITGTFVKYMPSTNPDVTGIKFYCNYSNTSYINIIDKNGNILLSNCVIDGDVKNMMLDTYSKKYPGLNKPKDVPLYATIDKNGNPVIYWYNENKIIGKVNVTEDGKILKNTLKVFKL